MAKLFLYWIFSVLVLIHVNACRGTSSKQCLESDYPVCATNGTHWFLFKNQCRLNAENTNRERHGVAKLKVTRISNCFKKCDQVCTSEHAPICARSTEGQKTFQNRCQLDLENCKSGNIWKIVHEGECPVLPIPQKPPHTRPRGHNRPVPISHPRPRDRSRLHIQPPRRPNLPPLSLPPQPRIQPPHFPNRMTIESQCPSHCPLEYDPICANLGDVDQTFSNQCFLDADMCRSKRAWIVKHNGKCIEPEPEPECEENCPRIYSPMCATFNGENRTFSNECLLDLEICLTKNQWNMLYNGECRKPIMQCPSVCPQIFQPICATHNGVRRTFPNQCFVQIESCRTNQDWRIVSEGQCQPVQPTPRPTTPNQNCPDVCPAIYAPICAILGGNKRTFSNGCELGVETCKSGQNWKPLFNGTCETEHGVYPQHPTVLCSAVYQPVCAALNGMRKTFSNQCQLNAEIARTNQTWTLIASRSCETLPPFVQLPHNQFPPAQPPLAKPPIVQPPFAQTPHTQFPRTQPPFAQPPYNGLPLSPSQPQPPFEQLPPDNLTLGCPRCSNAYKPVCGFHNGEQQTFNNECLLLTENCYSNKKWIVGYEGECRSPGTQRDCPNICPLNFDPVCATFNGVRRTFPNKCELNYESHITNAQWIIVNVGECDYCPSCSDNIASVCAEFNEQTRTFDNACKMEAENCKTKSGWKIVARTACPINNCSRFCTKIYDPVCAISKGEARTFSNSCEMQIEACNTNTVWNIISKGECPSLNEKCPQSCSLTYSPVCAVFQGISKEFINECFLRSENCKTNKSWEFLKAGPCLTPSQIPQVNPTQATSDCNSTKCLAFRDPICARFNGEEKTFTNACFLNNVKCRTGNDWKVISNGPCRKIRSTVEPEDLLY